MMFFSQKSQKNDKQVFLFTFSDFLGPFYAIKLNLYRNLRFNLRFYIGAMSILSPYVLLFIRKLHDLKSIFYQNRNKNQSLSFQFTKDTSVFESKFLFKKY
jgi:hypothetical protein